MSEIMQISLKQRIAFIVESQVIEDLLQTVLTSSCCPEIIELLRLNLVHVHLTYF